MTETSSFAQQILSGLNEGAFAAHYQPKFDPKTEDVIGVEALLRWDHPDQGRLEAGRFMADVEREGGLDGAVDEWVLGETTRQGRAWIDAGTDMGTLYVNISSWLEGDTLLQRVQAALKDSALPANKLALECPWRLYAAHADALLPTLRRLSELNCLLVLEGVPLDQDCLNQVKGAPFQWAKACISYIQDFTDKHGAGALKRLIKAWESEGIRIAAIGVETEAQLTLVQKGGCRFAQGHRFKHPLPGGEIGYLIRALNDAKAAFGF